MEWLAGLLQMALIKRMKECKPTEAKKPVCGRIEHERFRTDNAGTLALIMRQKSLGPPHWPPYWLLEEVGFMQGYKEWFLQEETYLKEDEIREYYESIVQHLEYDND